MAVRAATAHHRCMTSLLHALWRQPVWLPCVLALVGAGAAAMMVTVPTPPPYLPEEER